MSSDSDVWDRFTLICKPEQSGKTFIMIQKINKETCTPSSELTVINLIFCDNNLLLTKQTSKRLGDQILLPETQEKYVEFSTRKDSKTLGNVDTVIGQITNGVQNVVCCTNRTRMRNTHEIISRLNSSPFTKDKLVFKLWLDEADKFSKYISNTLLPLAEEYENVHCFCITATPDRLFHQFGSMNIEPLMLTTSPNYHGWEDNNRILIENELGSTEGFVSQIMKTLTLAPAAGTKWFVPANYKKSSHRAVRDILLDHGFAVFTVNGDGIELVLPNSPDDPIGLFPKNDELNKQIIKLYQQYSLYKYPVAITGNLCVSRGISIMSPELMFDFGIISSCGSPSAASQNAGRLKGNIKDWDTYKPPTVYTTPLFDSIATEQEHLSRTLAGLAFEQDTDTPSSISSDKLEELGLKQKRQPSRRDPYPVEVKFFDQDEEAIKWVEITFWESNKAGKKAPKHMHKWRAKLKTGDKKLHTEQYYISQFEKGVGVGLGKRVWIKKEKLDDGRMIVYWNSFVGEQHRR